MTGTNKQDFHFESKDKWKLEKNKSIHKSRHTPNEHNLPYTYLICDANSSTYFEAYSEMNIYHTTVGEIVHNPTLLPLRLYVTLYLRPVESYNVTANTCFIQMTANYYW